MLKWYTNWNSSDVGMRNPDIDSAGLRLGYRARGKNIYNNLSYRGLLAERWKADIGLAYSYDENNTSRTLLNKAGQTIALPYEPFSYKTGQRIIKSDFAQARMVLTHTFSRNQAVR